MADVRATIYTRVSQDRAGEKAGVTRQREDCLRRARERGWDVASEHEDNDLSARSGRRREGFEAMLADITEGRVKVVIAWALDRLQRNRRDELRLYEACQEHEVTLSLVNGADLDFSTAAGRFIADNLGSLARMEVDMKSDRQKRAAQQAAEQGRPYGGRRPFGYEPDRTTIRDAEANVIRSGYTAYLSGTPLRQIARDWNATGLYGEQGAEWDASTVRQVLRNGRNAGIRFHRGEEMGPASWPGIVPEETWRATVGAMRSRGGAPHRARRMLTGLSSCGVCGGRVIAGGSARPGIANYRCGDTTGHFARMAEPVDEYVGDVVVARLSRPDARELLDDRERPDVAALRGEANAARERLLSVAVDFADGDLTAGQVRAVTERLQGRITDLETQIADAGRVDVLGPLVGDAARVWDGLDVDRRRAVVATLMTVTIHAPGRGVRTFRPETVGIEWRDDRG